MPASGGYPNAAGASGTGGFATGGTDPGGNAGAGGAGLGSPCDFSGTWATHTIVPVNWPATDPLILDAGNGNVEQWNLAIQHQDGIDIDSTTVPCSILLPDLQGDLTAGYAKFGIRFPDSVFDAGAIPWVPFVWHGSFQASGFVIQTDPFAFVVGAILDNATTAPWPAATALDLQDQDLDGEPGVTVVPATGTGYSLPPTAVFGLGANLIYIAERTVSSLSATVVSCDEVKGTATIVPVNGQSGIQSTVVGCRKTDGTACDTTEAAFINGIRPQFSPTGLGTFDAVRLSDGATCADVRNQFPD